jgi:hypothetical protein
MKSVGTLWSNWSTFEPVSKDVVVEMYRRLAPNEGGAFATSYWEKRGKEKPCRIVTNLKSEHVHAEPLATPPPYLVLTKFQTNPVVSPILKTLETVITTSPIPNTFHMP